MENPMKEVPAPKFRNPPIEPFTQEDVQRMLKACTYTREADSVNRRRFVMRRPTANRDHHPNPGRYWLTSIGIMYPQDRGLRPQARKT